MNIFLDANIVYKDPLFKKSYPKKLLEYAEHGLVNIYVSDIVKDEIINNHKVELQKSYSQYKSAIYNLNDFLPETFVPEKIALEDNYRELFDFYSKLEEKGIIEIFTYDNSLLPKIIQRSLDKKKPFATNKTELRDATIWLSIVEYIQKNNLKECVLISNNTSDFFNKEKSALHNDLKADIPNMEAYISIKDFFEDYSDDDSLMDAIENKVYDDFIKDENINNEYICNLLEMNFSTPISESYANYFINKEPYELVKDAPSSGYVDSDLGIEIISVDDIEIDKDTFNQTLIIKGMVTVLGYVDIYAYNPVYDSGDEKFSLYATKEIELDMYFDFAYNLQCEATDISITDVEIAKIYED